MKIICDIGIIRSNSLQALEELKDQLHVPKIAIKEILSTSDWKGNDYKRVIAALKKIKFLLKDSGLNLIQPEEIILSASGIHSLPPLPSSILQDDNLNELINDSNGRRDELIEWLQKWIDNDAAWEIIFPEYIKDILDEMKISLDTKEVDWTLYFFELPDDIKKEFIELSQKYLTTRTKLFVQRVHEVDFDKLLVGRELVFGFENLIVDVWAAYFYYRCGDSASINDQFDMMYPIYLRKGDKLWTGDKLTHRILDHHLNRPELLFSK